jgi:hypothetical protein
MKKLLLLVPALALLLTGCGTPTLPSTPTESPAAVTPSEAPTETSAPVEQAPVEVDVMDPSIIVPGVDAQTVDLLNQLAVAEEVNADAYDRDLFNHWISQSGGCDTRDVVLAEESVKDTDCANLNGEWVSEYDGVTVTNPSKLDIDHMVPLAEAWRSGAYSWDDTTREAFANDLSNPNALVAVTAGSNRSKSDQDPANWMPDTDACVYLGKWVGVKYEWKLTVDPAEKDSILSAMSFCTERTTTMVYEAPVPVAGVGGVLAPEAETAKNLKQTAKEYAQEAIDKLRSINQ